MASHSDTVAPLHRWHGKYPELGTAPLPVEPLLSEQVFAQHRDHVFKKCWLFVGRTDRIPNSGDYFVARIDIAKTSIVIIRQPDGEIGAFHNVCMHRGNKLLWNDEGRCGKFLSCNFHGWVFDTYGNLKSIPDADDFYSLDKSSLSLRKVRVEVWQGFIFVNLNPTGTQSLREYLGEMADRVEGYPFEELSNRTHWRTDVKCNWRIIADAQVETYHVPYLHANSVQGAFGGGPHCHALHFEAFGPHHMLSIPFNPEFEPKGVEALAFQYGSAMIETRDAADYKKTAMLNPSGAENWQFDLFHVFPNFNLLLFRGAYAIHHFSPTAVDRSTWDVHLYQAQPENAAQAFSQEQIKCVFREAITEDGGTHEHTQQALEGGALIAMQVKDDEIAVRHGYVTLENMIAQGEAKRK